MPTSSQAVWPVSRSQFGTTKISLSWRASMWTGSAARWRLCRFAAFALVSPVPTHHREATVSLQAAGSSSRRDETPACGLASRGSREPWSNQLGVGSARMAVAEVPFDLAEVKLSAPSARPGTVAKADAIAGLCESRTAPRDRRRTRRLWQDNLLA